MSDEESTGRCQRTSLRESEELLSLFIRHSPIFAYIKSVTATESRVLHASDSFQEMIGLRGSDIIGKTMAELFPADFAARITADDWAVVTGGEVLKLDEELNGRTYSTIKFPIAQGDKTLVAGYTIDITERKQAEAALRTSETQLNAILESTADGILAVDNQGKVVKVNRRFSELWHIPESLLARGDDAALLDFVLSQLSDPDAFLKKVQSLYGVGTVDRETILFKDGRVLERFSAPMVMAGAVVGRVWSFRDTTERKRGEAEREKLESRLRQSQKLQVVGQLAGGVAHDFNNMLAVILGFAEMALEKLAPADPARADILEVVNAGRRSADLTQQLLAFARKQTIAPQVLDINDTVAGILKMLQRLIGEDVQLLWRPGANLWPVMLDPTQISQVLANLAVNARNAINGVGKMIIETRNEELGEDWCRSRGGLVPGRYVMLAVSDDGCGMDKETLTQIFEPFFTTREMNRGTGLGLATVYGIVQQNHGVIDVYSEPGKGATFKIHLPRHESQEVAIDVRPQPDVVPAGTETVLLVEDEAALLDLSEKTIRQLGYTVLAAGSPEEAIRLATHHQGELHLLLTDVVMPGMNGRDLWEQLSALRPGMKCLFMSGYTGNIIAERGVLDKGAHFLEKPFSKAALAMKLRDALTSP